MPVYLPSSVYYERKQFLTFSFPYDSQRIIPLFQNCGSDLSCLCANSIGSQLQQCMDCTVSASPSVEGEAQSAISGWNQACNGNLSVRRAYTIYQWRTHDLTCVPFSSVLVLAPAVQLVVLPAAVALPTRSASTTQLTSKQAARLRAPSPPSLACLLHYEQRGNSWAV